MDQIKTGKLINGLCSLPCRYTGQEGLCGIVQNMGLCIRNCRVIPENSRPVAFNFIGNSNSRPGSVTLHPDALSLLILLEILIPDRQPQRKTVGAGDLDSPKGLN